PGVQRAAHNPDVFLRHRLLREPCGFEGFLARGEAAPPDELAISEGPKLEGRHLNGRAALSAFPMEADDRQNRIARVDQLLNDRSCFLEDAPEAVQEAHEVVDPVKAAGQAREVETGDVLELRCRELGEA